MTITIDGIYALDKMVWKTLPIATDYEVSEFGDLARLKDLYTRKRMRGSIIQGYKVYSIQVDGKWRTLGAHHLVALAFHGPRPTAKHQASHRDGNRLNNHHSNIRWATPKENQSDRIHHGTHKFGEVHPNSKLTESDVIFIRSIEKYPGWDKDIASKLGVSRCTVRQVFEGVTWKHVKA